MSGDFSDYFQFTSNSWRSIVLRVAPFFFFTWNSPCLFPVHCAHLGRTCGREVLKEEEGGVRVIAKTSLFLYVTHKGTPILDRPDICSHLWERHWFVALWLLFLWHVRFDVTGLPWQELLFLSLRSQGCLARNWCFWVWEVWWLPYKGQLFWDCIFFFSL